MTADKGTDSSFSAALCVNLRDQVHLIVFADSSTRSKGKLPEKLRALEVTIEELRSSMDPDAFILEKRPVAGIFRIPVDAKETFGADTISALLGRDYEPSNFRFMYD